MYLIKNDHQNNCQNSAKTKITIFFNTPAQSFSVIGKEMKPSMNNHLDISGLSIFIWLISIIDDVMAAIFYFLRKNPSTVAAEVFFFFYQIFLEFRI